MASSLDEDMPVWRSRQHITGHVQIIGPEIEDLFHQFYILGQLHDYLGLIMKIGEKNVGMIDRIIRIVLGIVLLYLFAVNMVAAPWSYLVSLIGLILLITGIIGTCALYSLISMNTLGKKA